VEHTDIRTARKKKQAELLKRGQDMRAIGNGTGGGSAKTKRFWKDVNVKKTDGMLLSIYVRYHGRSNG
jgi:ATP synthase F1 complex assembly factor 2